MIILTMAAALVLRTADVESAPDKTTVESEANPSVTPPLYAGTPAFSTERVGSLRLVPTTQLPPVKQPLQADERCPLSSLPNPSPEAKAAINAGWHVSADMTLKGFRFVMVDAGAKKASAGCMAIGASALVFNAHGLIAIAYDRNPKQSSRLSSLTIGESGALQLGALKGALAEVRVSDQQIALKSIATNKSKRASR
ncbi:hypothetical protein ABFU49_17005 [Xanthomonas campestris pv. campestris]|uniref:hypothetical protein n=1 Tax=Xanthomonas campestris TaxID=339 RepID=UPI001A1233A5|nr:hypothetical protein [Xanthomonas campestris]MBF9171412.1 hypothetical protein [Xanthomonas campestris pv. campestris]MDO0848394.1 hypothetical protein [Xanthomonas campestris pv. campestris]MEA9705204.1 hypothetical protein [Xanthomonas campestris pv. raphani]MEB1415912.1 hypothetical protein [Xanthomonas campestris pv. campestris]MEB1461656.1 hypothetical protein [Xanthomonas campestris pv. campestris]